MVHLIDKTTGLCVVCQRQDLAVSTEAKKFGRQNYDLRQLAIDVITDKNDPKYREILDRHYLKPSDFDFGSTIDTKSTLNDKTEANI